MCFLCEVVSDFDGSMADCPEAGAPGWLQFFKDPGLCTSSEGSVAALGHGLLAVDEAGPEKCEKEPSPSSRM